VLGVDCPDGLLGLVVPALEPEALRVGRLVQKVVLKEKSVSGSALDGWEGRARRRTPATQVLSLYRRANSSHSLMARFWKSAYSQNMAIATPLSACQSMF
jgi:hypothetical protein